MNPNIQFQKWLTTLPVDVYQHIIQIIFKDLNNSEDILINWYNVEEIPLIVKCCIENAAECEGHPFSFKDLRVVILKKVIAFAVEQVETKTPNITNEEILERIKPIVNRAERLLTEFKDFEMINFNMHLS